MTPEPALSMLWESTDPSAALTARFGFSDARHAASWLEATLDETFALRVERCDRLVISASKLLAWLTVDGTGLVAKCAVDQALFARLADVDALTAWLHAEGIPVAAPIAADDGSLRVERGGISLGLYPVIGGDLLDVGDESHVQAAGRMLATLHDALAAYPRAFADARPGEGQQLVHGDFRSANILHDGTGITAILDFDEVSHHSRAWELGRSAVLLATRYHDWRATEPEARRAFIAAYADVSPLTTAQRAQFDHVAAAVLQHFGWS